MKSTRRSDAETRTEEETRGLEGGVFYPVGYIVAGIPAAEDADRLRQEFLADGLRPNECVLARPEVVQQEAERELAEQGIIAALGSSAHVRKRQLQLAREGCSFLMIKAEDDAQRDAVMRRLEEVPVRYAVAYRRLIIEDLIDRVDSATADSANARTS